MDKDLFFKVHRSKHKSENHIDILLKYGKSLSNGRREEFSATDDACYDNYSDLNTVASSKMGPLEESNFDGKINVGDTGIAGVDSAGIVYSNIGNGNNILGEARFGVNGRGHGFAAERANHLYDKLTGNDVCILGDDCKKNGPDRMVNGVNIQSKYCSTGSKCIRECFDKYSGEFRYYNKDGSPMQIEVPSDKYDDAVRSMEDKIRSGKIRGVNDPNKAKDIVRKGHFTYEQAKNICRFGTVESLTYDAFNGIVVGTGSFAITFVLGFAVAVWNGKSFDEALRGAVVTGIKAFGFSFVSAIVVGQVSKTGVPGMVSNFSHEIVKAIGSKASAMIVNAFRSGKDIYGAAAMKSAEKLLGSNIVTGTISVVLLSTLDVVNIFRGRISGAQLFKNLVNTVAGISGGTGGAIFGAQIGASVGSIVPVVGNTVGGFVGLMIGAVAGGALTSKLSKVTMDQFIEDDAVEMVNVVEGRFKILVNDYVLNKEEAEAVVNKLGEEMSGGSKLLDMYASDDRNQFADDILIPIVENVARERRHINLPSRDQVLGAIRNVVEWNVMA